MHSISNSIKVLSNTVSFVSSDLSEKCELLIFRELISLSEIVVNVVKNEHDSST